MGEKFDAEPETEGGAPPINCFTGAPFHIDRLLWLSPLEDPDEDESEMVEEAPGDCARRDEAGIAMLPLELEATEGCIRTRMRPSSASTVSKLMSKSPRPGASASMSISANSSFLRNEVVVVDGKDDDVGRAAGLLRTGLVGDQLSLLSS